MRAPKPGGFSKRLAGTTPAVLTPPTYNRFAQAADMVETWMAGVGIPGQLTVNAPFDSRAVKVLNAAGKKIERGHCLRLTDVAVEPKDYTPSEIDQPFTDEFVRKPVFQGVLPTADAQDDIWPLGIAMETVPDGVIGSFAVGHVVPAFCNLPHEGVMSVGVDYAAAAGDESILLGGIPGLPLAYRYANPFTAGKQWCLVHAASMIDRQRCRIVSTSEITARSGDTPGTGTADLYYLDLTTDEYVSYQQGKTIRNWSLSPYSNGASGWAERDGAGVWHAVGEECDAAPLGIGSMSIGAPPKLGDAIGSGWTALDEMDTIDLTPDGCTLNTTDGSFSIDREGIWNIQLFGNISHEESNQGRETNVRLYDVTGAAPTGSESPIFIGRNQPGSQFSFLFPATIDGTNVGNTFRFEIGGGDTIAAPDWNQQAIDLQQIR